MEKDHFEILLEHVESNTKLLAEGLVGVNQHLERLESGQEAIKEKLLIQDVLVTGQEVIKAELRDMKRNQGLLNSIANDHESRIQGIESQIKDHIDNHS
ncbi:hypothetical protein ACFL2F_05280 [Myxococcota bacterium]